MSRIGNFSSKTVPWVSVAKAGLAIGGACAVLALVWVNGSDNKNAQWLEVENTRIAREAESRLKAVKESHKFEKDAAVKAADALARSQEREKSASDRADEAEKTRNAAWSKNNDLYKDLKSAQNAAVAAGDSAGLRIMPQLVRSQTADRLDRICENRPSECRTGTESGPEIQDASAFTNPQERIEGRYPSLAGGGKP